MPTVTSRVASPDDAAALAELWHEFGEEYAALDPSLFQVPAADGLVGWMRAWLESDTEDATSPSVHFVAERGSAILGYVSAKVYGPSEDAQHHILRESSDRVLHVDSLMVTAPARRSGIARQLMDDAERWGRIHGSTRLVVIASTFGEASMRFYEDGLGLSRITVGFSKRLQ